MSVRYNNFLGSSSCCPRANSITLPHCPNPEGAVGGPRTIVSARQINRLYAPYIWPRDTGGALYFVASRWDDYNVMLIRADLSSFQ